MELTEDELSRLKNRSFSLCPRLVFSAGQITLAENDLWLELSEFIIEDLQWLLSLDNSLFWSYLLYSKEANQLISSILREFLPIHFRYLYKIDDEIDIALGKIEYLVFLIFARLGSDIAQSSDGMKGLEKINDENSVLTVASLLDFCSFFGENNVESVKKILNIVFRTRSHVFGSDLQRVVDNFLGILKSTRYVFGNKSSFNKLGKSSFDTCNEASSLLFLHDAVATLQMFFYSYPEISHHISPSNYVHDIASFYSTVLPQIQNSCPEWSEFVDKIRIDLLKIVRSAFEFLLFKAVEGQSEKEEIVDEYLTLAMELLSETDFLRDYNRFHPLNSEINNLVEGCPNVDMVKLDHVLQGIAQSEIEPGTDGNSLENLVAEVKAVLPHANCHRVRGYLERHGFDVEKTVAALLDTSETFPPPTEKQSLGIREKDPISVEGGLTGKRDLGDADTIDKTKYARWFFVADTTYDDEYDDTYEDEAEIVDREEEEEDASYRERRPFVVPRVLRSHKENLHDGERDDEKGNYVREDEEQEEEEEEEEEEVEVEVEEATAAATVAKKKFDVIGRVKGRGQTNEVTRNRNRKEINKSFIGNHNRKRQAEKKRNRGMMPF